MDALIYALDTDTAADLLVEAPVAELEHDETFEFALEAA